MISLDAFIMLAPWHPGEKMTHLDSCCSAGCIIIQHPTLQHGCECNISFLGYVNQTKSKMAEYPKYLTSSLTGTSSEISWLLERTEHYSIITLLWGLILLLFSIVYINIWTPFTFHGKMQMLYVVQQSGTGLHCIILDNRSSKRYTSSVGIH